MGLPSIFVSMWSTTPFTFSVEFFLYTVCYVHRQCALIQPKRYSGGWLQGLVSFLDNIMLLPHRHQRLGRPEQQSQGFLPSFFTIFVSHWNMFAGTPFLLNTIRELYSQLLSTETSRTEKPRGKEECSPSVKPAIRLLPW